jgi:hypothetical protein
MARDLSRIATVKIYPAIGIARLGNSRTSFFVGPERPGDRTPPAGGYKDARCAVRRQAARFRLYGFDSAGALVGEITAADAKIEWTVHVANRKADARQFDGLNGHAPFRNTDPLPGVASITDRAQLVIDPGPRTVSGPSQSATFDTGTFLGTPVPLGEIRTDSRGRLLVLGGFGRSGSPLGVPLATFANNDRWFDDVSDGPVTASVRFGRSRPLTAVPAWVINGPPDFAPAVESVTSLYDALFQVFVDKGWLAAPDPPSLGRDVWPLLRRALAIESTSMMAAGNHAGPIAAAFPALTPQNKPDRDKVLAKINNPDDPDVDDADMPMLWSDVYTPGKGETMTRVQYNVLTRWQNGDVVDDWTGSEPAPAATVTPDGLTRAALEACVGGPFYPGIEASWFLRDTYAYLEPFRLDPAPLQAGDVTKQMAVPWQADFTDCTQDGELAWWPAQRPDDVFPAGMSMQMPWVRDIVASPDDMVHDWSRLGFVVEQDGKLVEIERTKVCRRLTIVAIRTELTLDEVRALTPEQPPLVLPNAFLVIADGFAPAELGIDPAVGSPDTAGLRISVKALPGGRTVRGLSAAVTEVLLEDPAALSTSQRITFVCALVVADDSVFAWRGSSDLLSTQLSASARVGSESHSDTQLFQLSRGRGPYVVDGAKSWASEDLRVMQVRAGDTVAGVKMGNGQDAPTAFIAALLENLNAESAPVDSFDSLPSNAASAVALISPQAKGKPVYSFAVLRVRDVPTADAPTTALFRLFRSLSLGTDHSTDTFRRSPSRTAPAPLLGVRGGELVSIPCFAAPRVDVADADMRTQQDPANRWTPETSASAASTYFGCWLDVNQSEPAFPRHPATPHGPFEGLRRSIQHLLRGGEISLVAELYTSTRPLHPGTSPASTTRLAMRSAASAQVAPASGAALATAAVAFSIRATPAASPTSPADQRQQATDELIIDWHELPPGTEVRLYLPSSSVEVMMSTARKYYETLRLERIDHHTVRLLPADVTYLPLPAAQDQDQPALLTMQLPTLAGNSTCTVTISQRSVARQQLVGTIGISLVKATPRRIVADATGRLAVLRGIDAEIARDDPWRGVSVRQTAHLADQIRQFGGDPDAVDVSSPPAAPQS